MAFDLFETESDEANLHIPLAERVRPMNFDEFVGQSNILGKNKFLRKLIEEDKILSMIFYGPPGTGKTTLAKIIAQSTKSIFKRLNATNQGISDVRLIIKEAQDNRKLKRKRTIVFIDEIHRFNKSQQDVLLPYVEDGSIILIGATTENPYFEVNHALLSRVKIVKLEPLEEKEILHILKNALRSKKGLNDLEVEVADEILLSIANLSQGDARYALNLLEEIYINKEGNCITEKNLEECAFETLKKYDKNGDMHYDVISAFIKSMRGSDPDATLYYLGKMLASGEDINFIGRRIIICASEDVGNADPNAIVVANSCIQGALFVGMPEARILLSQAAVYIACAPKSNASYMGIDKAIFKVNNFDTGVVPNHLKDAHYKNAKKLGHGENYLYPHDYTNNYVEQNYLPEKIKNEKFYIPTENGYEKKMKEYLQKIREDSFTKK